MRRISLAAFFVYIIGYLRGTLPPFVLRTEERPLSCYRPFHFLWFDHTIGLLLIRLFCYSLWSGPQGHLGESIVHRHGFLVGSCLLSERCITQGSAHPGGATQPFSPQEIFQVCLVSRGMFSSTSVARIILSISIFWTRSLSAVILP